MKKALADRIEQRVRSAFPDGAIARVQILEHGEELTPVMTRLGRTGTWRPWTA